MSKCNCTTVCLYAGAVAWSSTGVGQVAALIGVPLSLCVALIAKIGQWISNFLHACFSEDPRSESKWGRRCAYVSRQSLTCALGLAAGAIPFVGASLVVYLALDGLTSRVDNRRHAGRSVLPRYARGQGA